MRKIGWSILSLWLCGLLASLAADSYQLADGTTVGGNIVSFTENGIIFRSDDDKYTDRLPWLKFSQDSLIQLAQNPKIAPYVNPFIEPPPMATTQIKTINISEPTRLEYSTSQSFFGALFGSPVFLLAFLLIYAGNIFAGYEVAIYRKKPMASVLTASALLPVLGPAIFLSMMPLPAVEETPVEEGAAPATPTPQPQPHHFTVPQVDRPAAASSSPVSSPNEEIHIVASGFSGEPPPAPVESKVELFQRGQYMFNRRFFETKFSGFFSIVRSEADRGKVMTVKIPAMLLTVERIARIGANEVYFDVVQGGQRQEMMVPFADIQQIQIKQK
jgi:hypothetical protein